MKKNVLFIILYSIFCCLLIFPQNNKPVVAVILPENSGSKSSVDVVCFTIKDTVALTLKLIGRYTVREDEQAIGFDDFEAIKQYAADNTIDSIIFGRISENSNGQIIIELAVYDKYKDSITIKEQKTAADIFDIFNAADEIIIDLIEGFSGIRVAYGSINIINNGAQGNYSVFINEEFIGDNITSINRVFIGKHRIKIVQERLLEELVLLNEDIVLNEEDSIKLDIAITYLTAREEEEFKRIDKFILTNWYIRNKRQEILEEFDKALGLLDKMSGYECFQGLQEKYNTLYQKYQNPPDTGKANLDIATLSKEDFPRLALQKDNILVSADTEKLDAVNTTGSFSYIYKQYLEKPDWGFFSQLTADFTTTDPELISRITQPILDTIADKPPDFADDFSKNTGWNRWCGGGTNDKLTYRTISQGKLTLFTDKANNPIHIGNPKIYYNNFIVKVDIKFESDSGHAHISCRQSEQGNYSLSIANTLCCFDFYYYHIKNNKKEIFMDTSLPEIDYDDYFSITFIAKENSFAGIINGIPFMFVYDSGKKLSPYISLDVGNDYGTDKKTAVASFDNFKIWNLDKLSKE